MTIRTRKRDLRTRVTLPAYERVRLYAAARAVTVYEATERLVLLGLDEAGVGTKDTASPVPDPVAQFAARIDALAAVTDRAAFGAFVAYAYARHSALGELTGDPRQSRDRALLEAGQETYQRQLSKVLEK